MESLDIGKELGKMKPKEKNHKIRKLPEKFKYYSQDIKNIKDINDNNNKLPAEYQNISEKLMGIDLNKPDTEISAENLKNLEEFTSEQVLEILNEEFEESGNHSSEINPSKEEIENLIKITSKETINKLEYNPEIDDFIDIDVNENNSKAKEHFNEEEEDLKDEEKNVINLNDKYGFKVGNIEYKDITFKNSNKKLIYNKTEYFKCSNDYNNKRYFTCANYNRKSKINSGEKICTSKIIEKVQKIFWKAKRILNFNCIIIFTFIDLK